MAAECEGLRRPVDEIDIIEAALGAAKLKSPLSPETSVPVTSVGMAYTNADAANVSVYGAQLKNWIDMQVNTRLDLVLARQAEESAITLAGMQHSEGDIESLKEMQSKLFSVVEGLSQQMIRVKTAVAANTQAKLIAVVETLSEELARTKSTLVDELESLKTSVAFCEVAVKDVAVEARQVDLDEVRLRKDVEDSQGRLSEDLAGLQRRLVAELRAETVAALQTESDAIARLDQRLFLLDQRLERAGVLSDRASRPAARSQSPRSPRSPIYSPGWNIIGGRLVSEHETNLFSEHLAAEVSRPRVFPPTPLRETLDHLHPVPSVGSTYTRPRLRVVDTGNQDVIRVVTTTRERMA